MTQLWRHFELRHALESDLVFKCEQCYEGFATRAFLNVHIKEKHEHQVSRNFFYCVISLTIIVINDVGVMSLNKFVNINQDELLFI